MIRRKVLVLVPGYGCHLTEKMKGYLDMVADFVNENEAVIEAVLTTGGYTNRKTAPGISEAGMMTNYLEQKIKSVPIITSALATTTKENVDAAKVYITSRQSPTEQVWQVIIFCDTPHKLKMLTLARVILGFRPDVMSYPITGGLMTMVKQTVIGTPLSLLALRYPFFKKLEDERRQRIMNES